MRPTHTVETIFGTRSRVAVLRVLHGVSIPLNASQIATRTGLTWPAVNSVLDELSEAGIVRSSSAGRANVHMLIRDNVYARNIISPAFAGEQSIPETMLDYLRECFEPFALSVVLFGSYARGDQTSASDVDVVLVAADRESKKRLSNAASDAAPDFFNHFGAHLSPLVYDLAEASHLPSRAPELDASMREDALTVCGLDYWEWGDGFKEAQRKGDNSAAF